MINKDFHKTTTDVELELEQVKAAQKDSRKFEVLYNRYHEQIFRYVYARVENKHLASDLTSQTFYKAMLNLENYSFKGVPFSSWLYRIAFNEMNMHFRKASRSRVVNIETHLTTELFSEMEEDIDEERLNKLGRALVDLPEEKLSLIEMRFFEQRSFKEIAQIMGITENNAKVKVYRTLDKIKNFFNIKA